MRVLYFDCFAGAAGDMILGALLDAGLPLDALEAALGSLAIDGCRIRRERVLRAGVSATKFRVDGAGPAHDHGHDDEHGERLHLHGHAHADAHEARPSHHPRQPQPPAVPHSNHSHHSVAEIKAAVERSALTHTGKARAGALVQRLAEAEAAIHGVPVERVHLHEVGAIDSIVDIVGAVFALEWFAADRVVVSPLNVGGGMVRTAHGLFPVPAPATVSLLGDAPIYASGIDAELLTPTGALILTGHATAYGPLPPMRIRAVGYGAGDRDLPGTPNVLRVFVGDSDDAADPAGRVAVVECEIDDMNPQLFGPLMERLAAAGAVDVFYTPIQMKKGRPGTLVTAIVPPADRDAVAGVLFRETTTIGVRWHEADREVLPREVASVTTPAGPVRVKVARRGGRVVNVQPEFEDVLRAAEAAGLSAKDVHAMAYKAWFDARSGA